LLCAPDGCPIAIEVFEGNTGDPKTLAVQVEKLKQRFHLDHVVMVGDRGMITQARISDDIEPADLDWISALRGPAIKALLESGALQLTCSTGATGLHHRPRLSRRAADCLPQR
jgi:transposase